ncbi:MAG: glycoside hydrolase family 3 N-terminal domain-containing protein, partial [Chloroflexota bacterium]|nr:glycoside hydrolase family 3 N-terminal domain-containing protein [Chloroflexota bacterium]
MTETEVVTVEVPVIVPGETVVVEVEVPVPGETVVVEVPVEVIPPCGPTQPQGACGVGETCFGGACVVASTLCSPTNPNGVCAAGLTCFTGGCVLTSGLCGAANLAGPCEVGSTCVEGDCVGTADLCSSVNHEGLCPTGLECNTGICAEPFVDPCTVHVYTEQPVLGVSTAMIAADKLELLAANYTTWRADNEEIPLLAGPPTIIKVDGFDFKDLNKNGTLDPYEDWRLNESCRAWDLVSQMTLPQKIGTMSEGGRFGNGTADSSLTSGTIAAVVNLHRRYSLMRTSSVTAAQVAQYHNNLQALMERQPLGIPGTLTADPIHGFGLSTSGTNGNQSVSVPGQISAWPYPIGIGAINDLVLTHQFADTVRQEFMEMGLRWQLGPMADLATEPRWARVQNVFGENAFHVAMHVRTTIAGFQGNHVGGLRNGIAATMKHFPGAGMNEDGMDSHTYAGRYNVFPGNHFTYHLIPFQAAIDAGAAAVMPCYSIYKGQMDYNPEQVAAGTSYTLMTTLMKEEMGFTGMVTGDWGNLSKRYNQEAMSNAQYSAMWLHAGSHQYGSDAESNFLDAYNQGYIDDWDIDQAVHKIVEMTFKLGLFENPYVDPTAPNTRGAENRINGFNAQKRAMIMLR